MHTTRRVLTPGEVAARFRVSIVTVGKWADEGLIPSFRTPGDQRRFYEDEIEEYIAARTPKVADA